MTEPMAPLTELRELEARWRASGEVADQARWLRWRVYEGQLDEDRLYRAAHLRHLGAVAALQSEAPSRVGDLRSWIKQLFGRFEIPNPLPRRWELEPPPRTPPPEPKPPAPPPLDMRQLAGRVAAAAAFPVAPVLARVDLEAEDAKEHDDLREALGKVHQWLTARTWPCPLRPGHDAKLARLERVGRLPPADAASERTAQALRCVSELLSVLARFRTGQEPRWVLVASVASVAARATGDETAIRASTREMAAPFILDIR